MFERVPDVVVWRDQNWGARVEERSEISEMGGLAHERAFLDCGHSGAFSWELLSDWVVEITGEESSLNHVVLAPDSLDDILENGLGRGVSLVNLKLNGDRSSQIRDRLKLSLAEYVERGEVRDHAFSWISQVVIHVGLISYSCGFSNSTARRGRRWDSHCERRGRREGGVTWQIHSFDTDANEISLDLRNRVEVIREDIETGLSELDWQVLSFLGIRRSHLTEIGLHFVRPHYVVHGRRGREDAPEHGHALDAWSSAHQVRQTREFLDLGYCQFAWHFLVGVVDVPESSVDLSDKGFPFRLQILAVIASVVCITLALPILRNTGALLWAATFVWRRNCQYCHIRESVIHTANCLLGSSLAHSQGVLGDCSRPKRNCAYHHLIVVDCGGGRER